MTSKYRDNSAPSASHIQVIHKAIEFIESHLKEPITIADIADAVYYSLYHFCRTFNRTIHHTPYDYLMRRRLTESARDLALTDQKIIQIAFDYQFNNPETFSRSFKRMFGLQPIQWRKNGKMNDKLCMTKPTLQYIKHINKGNYLKPVLEEKDVFRVAGFTTIVQKDVEVILNLWQMLGKEVNSINNDYRRASYYGIVWSSDDWKVGSYFYMAGMEVNAGDVVNDTFVVKTIPAMKYARFIHKGSYKNISLTRDYIYHTWLPQSGEKLSCTLEVECHGTNLEIPDNENSERTISVPIV